MNPAFVSFQLSDLPLDTALPCDLFLCLNHKMMKYKAAGETVDAGTFDRLLQSRVLFLFIVMEDWSTFSNWVTGARGAETRGRAKAVAKEDKPLAEAIEGQRRAMLDIFTKMELGSDDLKEASVESRKLVTELMRRPYALDKIQRMQSHSKGMIDHSVNVAVLSAFFCHRLGYNHQATLETISMAGLLHDYGLVLPGDDGPAPSGPEDLRARAIRPDHPAAGAAHVAKLGDFPELLPILISQHHEFLDGSGYPRGLMGTSIHELSRVLCIVNLYDELISLSRAPTLEERVAEAVAILERDYDGKVDRKNLRAILAIVKTCSVKAA
jgi:HD-GYP domain-containing protein (c-di-GMP phosphodiesterase class II)